MNKARTIGPVLMIMLGLALVASPAQSAVDVGVLQPDPCQILTVTAATDPCAPDPCAPQVPRALDPCRPTVPSSLPPNPDLTTTTTTQPAETTTTEAPAETTTTVVDDTTTTVEVTTTTAEDPAEVAGDSEGRAPAATRGGALARTGAESGPLTAGGVALAALGVALLVVERRRSAARA